MGEEYYKLNVKIYIHFLLFYKHSLFHFLTCLTLCFYLLCAHEHMFYYGMCAVPNVLKLLLLL